MAFESLTERLSEIFKKMTGRGKISEKDLKESMREVKLALLEADVNYKVVKKLIEDISSQALGSEVLESITPGQQIIKITDQELVKILGDHEHEEIKFKSSGTSVIMLVGLQGSGKTTSAGKLANYIKKKGRNPILVACDVYRPAAIEQLKIVGSKISVPVFAIEDSTDVVDIAKKSIGFASENGHNVVILDTAGRLHTDDDLMQELKAIKNAIDVCETLLVVDSMTGQDAVTVATQFNYAIEIDGVVLTKLDGDTRGGAAISIKAVTGKPIKFIGNGEKLENLENFYPQRMASRILGMGDVLSLIDKVEESISAKKAEELEQKMRSQRFTLDDFLSQISQIKKMGPISQLISMIPGLNASGIDSSMVDEKRIVVVEAIIQSMTKREREHPEIINASRKRRIASGSGRTVQEINLLLKQFEQMQTMMKRLGKMGKKSMGFKLPF